MSERKWRELEEVQWWGRVIEAVLEEFSGELLEHTLSVAVLLEIERQPH
jgi:hypothetical protein